MVACGGIIKKKMVNIYYLLPSDVVSQHIRQVLLRLAGALLSEMPLIPRRYCLWLQLQLRRVKRDFHAAGSHLDAFACCA